MMHSVAAVRPGGVGSEFGCAAPAVLKPYDPNDAIGISKARALSGEERLRLIGLAQRYGLGRKIGARWAFSRVALRAFLDGDEEGLAAYLAGDRTGPAVTRAYQAAGVPLQGRPSTSPA
ncbi:hypothetical protein [Methylobacterium nigriterrae]|uniref:hypothetical protein n=1 Tax=Methylobacterium nigriterrae TaxID=3127512 RepID=UPI0030134403